MGAFENFLDEAKKIAIITADKAAEIAHEGKEKLQKKEIEYDIKKLYIKIGKACYKSVKNDTDNSKEINEYILKIDELKNKIDKE